MSDAFLKPDGAVFGPVAGGGMTLVAKVLSHVQPDMSKLPEQRVAIRDEIKGQKGRERNGLFDAGVRSTLEKEGKIRIHNDVMLRLWRATMPIAPHAARRCWIFITMTDRKS